jgi:hypothetical protein
MLRQNVDRTRYALQIVLSHVCVICGCYAHEHNEMTFVVQTNTLIYPYKSKSRTRDGSLKERAHTLSQVINEKNMDKPNLTYWTMVVEFENTAIAYSTMVCPLSYSRSCTQLFPA